MRYFLYSIIVFFWVNTVIPALASGAEITGQYLRPVYIAATTRSLALGGSMNLSNCGEGNAMGNPAGIYSQTESVNFSMRNLSENLSRVYLISYNWYDEKNAYSLLLHHQEIDDIANTNDAFERFDSMGRPILDYSRIRTYSDLKLGALFAVSHPVNSVTRIGISVKPEIEKIDSEAALGCGFDAGIIREFPSNMYIGFSVQNILPGVKKWSTGTTEITLPGIRGGVEKRINQIALYLDTNIRFINKDFTRKIHGYHIGIEYNISDIMQLRAGRSDVFPLTAGIGIIVKKYQFDYSYMVTNNFFTIHSVSLRTSLKNLGKAMEKIHS